MGGLQICPPYGGVAAKSQGTLTRIHDTNNHEIPPPPSQRVALRDPSSLKQGNHNPDSRVSQAALIRWGSYS